MEQQEVVVACARATVRWLKKAPEHHHADRHRKAWAAAKPLSAVEQSCVVGVSRAGFSLRGPAEALIPLARITRWGHDASDFFVEAAAADASVTGRTDGVIRIVVGTRDGARLATLLRNHAIRALRAIDAAAAAARPRVNRRRLAVDEALIAAASPLKPSAREPPRDGRVAIVQAVWRGARLRLAWRREESALVLQCFWRGQLTRRE
jgi:hypothetical protein